MIKFSFHISYWGLCHRLFFSSLLFKSYGDLGILFSENDGIFYILYFYNLPRTALAGKEKETLVVAVKPGF